MTNFKTGVDMVYIPRFISFLDGGDSDHRASKIFTEEELVYCRLTDGTWNYQRLAARFAAKEAVAKALGTGFSNGLYFKDFSVGKKSTGEPYIILSEKAQHIFDSLGGVDITVSLTHENEYACASVIATFEK